MVRDPRQYHYITKQDYEAAATPNWPSYEIFQQHRDIADSVYNQVDQRLCSPQGFQHPSFCVLPFYGFDYPDNVPCCLLKAPVDVEKIKQDMLAGRRPDSCRVCWDQEDRGIKSDRMLKNETLDFYLDKNLQDLFNDCQQGKNYTTYYKIDTSNTCNATCVTCGSFSSSAWAQLERKNQSKYYPSWKILPEQADTLIDYARATAVNFRGGEPLLSDTNFHILEQLIANNNTNCFISFQTNGSIIPSLTQEKILMQFKNLNFSFSIDGVGPVFEYLRYPLKWHDIQKTREWCQQRGIEVSASYTVSNLNVLYHKQTTEWFDQHGIKYHVNPIYSPKWFSPNALPMAVKSQIDFGFSNLPGDEYNYQQFRKKIAQQDAWKGIRWQDYLPELAELLG